MDDAPATRCDRTIRLPCEPRAARTARRFVDAALSRWGEDDLDRELALLAVSELVANAVLHAPGRLAVRCVVGEALRLEVVDGHADAVVGPPPRAPGEIGGLGLRLVARIARDWGVERGPDGKTVWCILEHRRQPADHHRAPHLG